MFDINALGLEGLCVVKVPTFEDSRGGFLEMMSPDLQKVLTNLGARGVVQVNAATNTHALTLRGLHWQRAPHAQGKFVRVLTGAIEDVVVDQRSHASTFGCHARVRLTPQDGGLWVPAGLAHGYITLEANTTVLYAVDYPWVRQAEAVASMKPFVTPEQWANAVINERDRSAPCELWPTSIETPPHA